jgi:hypothetical protein
MTREEFVEKCLSSLDETNRIAKETFESFASSGAVDFETADMIDVKAAVSAFFETEANQRAPLGTSHSRRFKYAKFDYSHYI